MPGFHPSRPSFEKRFGGLLRAFAGFCGLLRAVAGFGGLPGVLLFTSRIPGSLRKHAKARQSLLMPVKEVGSYGQTFSKVKAGRDWEPAAIFKVLFLDFCPIFNMGIIRGVLFKRE